MRHTLVNISLGVVIGFCLSPLLAVFWSSWFAARHGCSVNEAFAESCVVNGKNWGPLLSAAFNSGWLMLIGLPLAIITLVYLLSRIIKRRRAEKEG